MMLVGLSLVLGYVSTLVAPIVSFVWVYFSYCSRLTIHKVLPAQLNGRVFGR